MMAGLGLVKWRWREQEERMTKRVELLLETWEGLSLLLSGCRGEKGERTTCIQKIVGKSYLHRRVRSAAQHSIVYSVFMHQKLLLT